MPSFAVKAASPSPFIDLVKGIPTTTFDSRGEDTYLFPTRYCNVKMFPSHEDIKKSNLILRLAEISPAQAVRISIIISSRKAFENTSYGQNLSLEEEGENIQEGPSGAAVDSPAPAEDQVQSPEPVATPEVAQGKRSEKRFVHSDGRQYPALEGSLTPYYAKVPGRGNVGQRDMFKDGFELKDVEI